MLVANLTIVPSEKIGEREAERPKLKKVVVWAQSPPWSFPIGLLAGISSPG